MEKADILELAVSHLRLAQSRDAGDSGVPSSSPSSSVRVLFCTIIIYWSTNTEPVVSGADSKVKGSSGGRSSEEAYAAGYNACLEQTRRFLVAQEQNAAQTKGSALASALEVEFRAKLVEHLAEQLVSRGDQQQPRASAKVQRSENTSTSSSSSSSSSSASSEPNAATQQASPTATTVSSTVARQAAVGTSPSRAKCSEQKNGAIATTSANNGGNGSGSGSGSGSANGKGNGVLTGRLPSGELALVLPVGNTVPAVDVGVLGSLSLLASSPLGALLGLSPGLPPPMQAASAPRPTHSRPAALSTAPVCASGPTGFLAPQPLPPLAPTSAALAGHLVASSAGPVVPSAPPVTAAASGCELGLLGALSQLLTLTATASASTSAYASASPHSALAAAVCPTAALPPSALKGPASGTVAPDGNELLQRLLTLQILGALAGTVSSNSSSNNNGNIKAEHTSQK